MKIQVTERGLIAVLTLVSCTTLLGLGINHIVGYSLLAVIVGYFGIEIWPLPQIRTRRRRE